MNDEYEAYDDYDYGEDGGEYFPYHSKYEHDKDMEETRLRKEMIAKHGKSEHDRLIDGINLEHNIFTNQVDNVHKFWGTFFNKSIYYPMGIEPDVKMSSTEQMTIEYILSFSVRANCYYFMLAEVVKSLYIDFIAEECVKEEYGYSKECISCSRENWNEKCDELFMEYLELEFVIDKHIRPRIFKYS